MERNLCVGLVIYQESLGDARSTECKKKFGKFVFVWTDVTSLQVHSQGFGFRKFQFPLPQTILSTERNVEICCHMHTLRHSVVISVITAIVGIWSSRAALRPAAYCVRFTNQYLRTFYPAVT